MDPDKAVADDVERNASAPSQGMVQADSKLATSSRDGEAK